MQHGDIYYHGANRYYSVIRGHQSDDIDMICVICGYNELETDIFNVIGAYQEYKTQTSALKNRKITQK